MSKQKLIIAIPNIDKVKFKCTFCNEESQEYDMPKSVTAMNEMAVSFGQNHKKCQRELGKLKK